VMYCMGRTKILLAIESCNEWWHVDVDVDVDVGRGNGMERKERNGDFPLGS
jgi:hypothetical protein